MDPYYFTHLARWWWSEGFMYGSHASVSVHRGSCGYNVAKFRPFTIYYLFKFKYLANEGSQTDTMMVFSILPIYPWLQ